MIASTAQRFKHPAAPPSVAPLDEGVAGRRGPAAVAAVLAAVVLAVLDTAIAHVALPTISRSLQVGPGASVWIITAYQTALVMGLLPCAALGESIGQRRVFTFGVALFTGASLLCAVSPSLPWLVVARFLQGLGASAIMALGMALLRLVVPHHRLGAAIGWNALAVALSSAAGPSIGAAILSVTSWPWLFALNLPLGGAVLLATRALPDRAGTARPLDGVSVILNGTAFAALVVGVEMLLTTPALAVLLLATAVVALTGLIRREMPKEAPLIPLDLLRDASFGISVMASICCFAGATTGLLSLSFYLQQELGQSTLKTGLFMTPWPLTVAIVAPMAGRLANRIPTAWLCAVGGICLAAGLTLASTWPLHGSLGPLVPITMLCGFGFGLFQVPNNRNMFLSTPRERSGAAGGMQATARLAGQTAGGVITGLVLTLASTSAAPRIGLAIGAALTLLAGLVSTLRSRANAAATPTTTIRQHLPKSRPGPRPRTHPGRSREASGAPCRRRAADARAGKREPRHVQRYREAVHARVQIAGVALVDAGHQIGGPRQGQRSRETSDDRSDVSLEPQRGQGVVDGRLVVVTARNVHVVGRSEPGGRDLALGQRMARPDHADVAVSKQCLRSDFRPDRLVDHARFEIDGTVAHRPAVLVELVQEMDANAGRLLGDPGEQGSAEVLDETLAGAHREGSVEASEIERVGGPQAGLGLMNESTDRIAQLERTRRSHQTAPGADEQRVTGRFTQSRERSAHRRGAEVQSPRSTRHIAFGEQHVEGHQQIEIGSGQDGRSTHRQSGRGAPCMDQVQMMRLPPTPAGLYAGA